MGKDCLSDAHQFEISFDVDANVILFLKKVDKNSGRVEDFICNEKGLNLSKDHI